MTVTTDKADYAAGSTATFTVAGVNSGSSVAFQIADLASDPGINGIAHVYAPFSVTDGGTGDADGLANGAVLLNGKSPPMAAPPAPCCSLRPSPAARPPPRRSATRPTRSCSRTKRLAIRRANGASTAQAARTSRASPPTSAPIVARPSTSRSTRIPTTIASTSIGSAITAAWSSQGRHHPAYRRPEPAHAVAR